MDTKILGLSGRKQSGKNTICNFLHGMKMVEIGLIENFRFSEAGELIVPTQTFDDDGNETVSYGEFNLERKDMDFSNFMGSLMMSIIGFMKALRNAPSSCPVGFKLISLCKSDSSSS